MHGCLTKPKHKVNEITKLMSQILEVFLRTRYTDNGKLMAITIDLANIKG